MRGLMIAVGVFCSVAQAADWPQWLGENRDSVWKEEGTISVFPKEGPKVRWRVPVGGGYAGPAVAGSRVYVTDRQVKEGAARPKDQFAKHTTPGQERVICVDDATGRPVWTYSYDCEYSLSYAAGPRCTPVVDGDRVYALGAEGHLVCLTADAGKMLWRHKFEGNTPLWGYAGHPLIDGDRIISLASGTPGSVVALNKHTGKELWSALPVKDPGYAPPMIYKVGEHRQLIVWHPESVNSLNPETGEVYWSHKFGPVKNGVSICTPRYHEIDGKHLLYVTEVWDGSLMLELDPRNAKKVSKLWQRGRPNATKTEAIQSLMSTTMLVGRNIYGVDARGELRCLDVFSGDRLWGSEELAPNKEPVNFCTSFLVKNGDKFFITTDSGDAVIAKLTPAGYEELSRARVLEATNRDSGRPVVWCHPAYANGAMYWRNDKEMVSVELKE